MHRHQQLHEGTLAVEADILITDNLDELLLTIDGAADRVNDFIVPNSTSGEKVSQQEEVD